MIYTAMMALSNTDVIMILLCTILLMMCSFVPEDEKLTFMGVMLARSFSIITMMVMGISSIRFAFIMVTMFIPAGG